ncbi:MULTISPECIES: MBL fold metallo-hydrolase [Streptosporangium]|uniref:Glyoxylase-like metal-dependent hydrolase (Beta-lactamase superfamily II) n=1 Tax=Streptosporangium brasiliense TaxID=47480 RepID=A0ABT9R231_9ACTN|nr:MBL fold metallo-hydrolase [Streptosporangium brasiliense]MDP9862535.1 glyoxylase-like metal-dependent hydrolase (beta-lactamase superfamily II) [Streptosporangium brasiliense]
MEGRWIEVADRVLVRRYTELDLSVGLVMGDGGCLVVDTRGDERQGAELAAEVRRITRDPWTVVITHSHFDHSFGTRPFLDCPVWAQEGCRADLIADGAGTKEAWARRYRQEGRADIADDIAKTEIVLPDRLVTDRAELTVGGREIVMAYFGRGHSSNDLVVHVPDAGVVFAGDLVENGAPPAYGDAYPLEWPAAVAGLLGLAGEGTVVPGHGDPMDRRSVTAQHADITAVAGLCREVAAGRMSVPEAVRLSPYPEDTIRAALQRPAG